MNEKQTVFLAKSDVKAHDLEHKRKLSFNIQKYNDAVVNGKHQFANLDLARRKAKNVKWKAIENLDKYLEQFEQNFTARGGKVIWAETAQDALDAVLQICKEKNAKQVVKAKSMVTEEIHLNDFLAKHNIESVETDLGEYIQQLDGEAPYHIVTPAMHKSKEDVARVFHEKLGTPPNLTPQEMTQIARKNLREKYITAEIGLSGGNFLLADQGAVCVTENEGNGRLSTAFPKTQIAIVGIEKMLPSINDLALFWPLLATYGTGQVVTVYNTIFTGPRQPGETDGPEEMYVILLDNGRTNLLRHEVRESMYCIRCGSCLNACPVYKNIGGHAYGATYSGPIGSVITPHLKGMEEYKHLSYASSLCGNCTEVCPLKINIHEMLLENRHIAANEEHLNGFQENMGWKLWKVAMLRRGLMNSANGNMKDKVVNALFKNSWGKERTALHFPKKSFNQLWKERNKN
ncbi:MAG: iron-sulfur cluster-binding protein [Taibaiella sp.]|nr:iron-sulfur cluster-binding protein [Taibaiella sp.]